MFSNYPTQLHVDPPGLSFLSDGLCYPLMMTPPGVVRYQTRDASLMTGLHRYQLITCLCLVKSGWAQHFRLVFCDDPILGVAWIWLSPDRLSRNSAKSEMTQMQHKERPRFKFVYWIIRLEFYTVLLGS